MKKAMVYLIPLQKTGNELLIFSNGALANSFLTNSFKRGFSRRRPFLEFSDFNDRAEFDAKGLFNFILRSVSESGSIPGRYAAETH